MPGGILKARFSCKIDRRSKQDPAVPASASPIGENTRSPFCDEMQSQSDTHGTCTAIINLQL